MIRSEEGLLGRAKIASEWVKPGDALLDIGCSNGELVSWVYPRCARALGLDIDKLTLRQAKERCPSAEFQLGSADELPFEDASFDVVSMLDVLEHVPDPAAAVREVDRVIRPGGRLILSVPHKGTFGFVDAQRSVLFAAGRRILLGKMDKVPEHRHYDLDELLSLLGPGYEVLKIHNGGYLLFPLCGYALMFMDSMGVKGLSRAIRKLEEMDFTRDYGERSWHLMLELKKRNVS